MTFKLGWTERGICDLEAAMAHIAAENPANARLVRERTNRTLSLLESFSLGLAAPAGTFKLYVPKTSYFLIFRREKSGDIKICAFFHASRDWEQIDWENL